MADAPMPMQGVVPTTTSLPLQTPDGVIAPVPVVADGLASVLTSEAPTEDVSETLYIQNLNERIKVAGKS